MDALGIHGAARAVQDRLIHVRAEKLERASFSLGLQEFHERHRQRIHLLPARAPRHPHAERLVAVLVFQDARKDFLFQDLERLRVAEKSRHRNQDVLQQRIQLAGILPKQRDVVRHGVRLLQQHAAGDAAVQRVRLVLGKINPRVRPQQRTDVLEPIRTLGRQLDRMRRVRVHRPRMFSDPHQFRADLLR